MSDFLKKVTPLILTYNEEANIERTISKLKWADRIVVIDSGSTDLTIPLLKKFNNVDIYQRNFDTHTAQWNYGLGLVSTDWVLTLDADYVLSDALIEEILSVDVGMTDGFLIGFKYCINGMPLRASILPPRLSLFKKAAGTYFQDGHTQRLALNGTSVRLKAHIFHDDRKTFSRWFAAQKKYSVLEAEKLAQSSFNELNFQDKLRKLVIFAPPAVFFYCLFFRGLIFDGWIGLIYSLQRALAESVLSWKLIQKHLSNFFGYGRIL